MKLYYIVEELNRVFDIESFGKDPGFSRFLPAAYESVGFDCKSAFEKEFTESLMAWW